MDFALAACNHSAMDVAGIEEKVSNGMLWARIPFKKSVPVDQSLATDFTIQGVYYPAGSIVRGYHATKYSNLFSASTFSPSSSGILHELKLRTGTNGHKGDYGVFFHAGTEGAAFYVQSARPQWPSEPMCFIELSCISAKKVKGGMAGRYCATGVPGVSNNKVQLVALWMLGEDVNVSATLPLAAQMPLTIEKVLAPSPFKPGLKVMTNWNYTAKEKSDKEVDTLEAGYLEFEADTKLLVLSSPYPGHAGNFYNDYVYAQNIQSSKSGWVPTLLLHQLECGAICV